MYTDLYKTTTQYMYVYTIFDMHNVMIYGVMWCTFMCLQMCKFKRSKRPTDAANATGPSEEKMSCYNWN